MANNKNFNVDDAEDFDDGTKAVTYDAELPSSDSENENARLTSSRKQRIQSKKLKQREKASSLRVKNWEADDLNSKEYAGKVVQRKQISGNQDDGEEEEDDDAMASPDEAEMEEWSEAEPFGESESEDDAEQNKDDDDDDDDDESEDDESDDDGDKDAEKLIRGFEKEDSAQLMSSKDSEKVVEKAVHVRHQKVLWERCLEVQIYTKRLLSTTKTVALSSDQDADDDKEKKALVINQLYSCIDAMSSLQDKLCNIPELSPPADAASKKRKRTVADLWSHVQESNQAILPQYNDILNTYTRKTNLAGAGSQAKKFKAVNQDILSQVESVLADVQRVKRKAHAPLEMDAENGGMTTAEEDDSGDSDRLDELMYDDSDFYQQLLKEFLESGGGSGQDTLLQRTHRKKKKIVNRKASKGRQLRYTVHPKLENFMFPDPYPKPEMDVDELFRSVFGQVSSTA
uniref:Apoptosis-antagonizing transcription factor C-terminal domain-containing protein n=1 Tax=Globisporangium ultimum (strain ATCC 200006 / CBS 805.95 / DAOM BR144) TaxID=431595 RepID=K3WRT7_GLOUD